jgi:hypothetical protein
MQEGRFWRLVSSLPGQYRGCRCLEAGEYAVQDELVKQKHMESRPDRWRCGWPSRESGTRSLAEMMPLLS